MPEGDTILRTARALQRAVGGQRIESAEPAGFACLVGRRVERVEAHGKHLLVIFDDARALHSHMRMNGAWYLHRVGEVFERPGHRVRARLVTRDFVATCLDAPVVELLRPEELRAHPALARLGPDVLDPDFDAGQARSRLRALADREIGDAILDQRALAGVGNVYKSEALFVARVSPFHHVADLDDATLDRVIDAARRLMRANTGNVVRRTASVGRHWVYDRTGRACRRCGGPVASRHQGEHGRTTYFCATCQT